MPQIFNLPARTLAMGPLQPWVATAWAAALANAADSAPPEAVAEAKA